MYRSWIAGTMGVVWCVAVGCSGDLDDPGRFDGLSDGDGAVMPGDCGHVPAALFDMSCTASVCHSPEEQAGGLDLTQNLEAQLVGVPSECDGSPRIDPSDPDGSLFLDKLEADPTCGDAMPLLGDILSAEDRACVQDWVRSLAGGGGQ
jgi:hypothetical protein